jgi:hypothetical protein
MKKLTVLIMLSCSVFLLLAQKKENQRLKDSYAALREILGKADKGIPTDLLNGSNLEFSWGCTTDHVLTA